MDEMNTNRKPIIIRSAEGILSETHFYYDGLLLLRNNTIGTYGAIEQDGINTYH